MTNRLIDPAKPDNSQPELAKSSAKTSAPEGDSRIGRKNNPAWGHALHMAETEEQWRELINHLPDNARQIWRALNDMKQFWGVLHAFGGQCIRVPRNVPKDRTHPLRKTLGLKCLRKLMATFGGTSLYVPRCTAIMTRLRQHEIVKGFSRSTGRGSSSTSAVSSLARRHGVSDRRVWQILKKESSVPPQAKLLLMLGDSAQISAQKRDNAL